MITQTKAGVVERQVHSTTPVGTAARRQQPHRGRRARVGNVGITTAAILGTVAIVIAIATDIEPKQSSGLVEGHDYSYSTSARWPCNEQINVRIAGTAPQGANKAVITAVRKLAAATNLDLELGPRYDRWPNTESSTAGEIVIYYVDPARREVPGMVFRGKSHIGLGGPTTQGDAIVAGRVSIRTDTRSTDPRTANGQWVIFHELAHAIGVGHSHAGEGVMQPKGGDTDRLSVGDRFALRQVGCPRP